MSLCACVGSCFCVVFAQEPKENLLGLTLKFHKLLIDYKVGQFPHTNSNIYRRTSFDDVARGGHIIAPSAPIQLSDPGNVVSYRCL